MKKNNNNNKMQNILYGILIAIGIILLIFILTYNTNPSKKDDKTISYTDLIKQVASRNVDKVEMTVGSTSLKVTLKNKIDENGQIIEQTEENSDIENKEGNTYENLLKKIL